VLLYIERWLTAPVQLEDGTLGISGEGYPAGFGYLAPAGEPFLALCV
jgi:hypothetical protein